VQAGTRSGIIYDRDARNGFLIATIWSRMWARDAFLSEDSRFICLAEDLRIIVRSLVAKKICLILTRGFWSD
jgi:hypothetical protein